MGREDTDAGEAGLSDRLPLASGGVSSRFGLFVCLVDLVHLVSFVQPNKRDKPSKPINGLLTLSNVPNILLEIHLELASAGDAESLLLITGQGPVKLR